MIKPIHLLLIFVICLTTASCNEKLFYRNSGTEVLLKDSKTLTIRIKFSFYDKASMLEFMSKKKKIMFAIRLSLRQHESSRLKGMGKRNVQNAIRSICRQLMDKKVAKITIVKYDISDKARRKGNKFPGPVDLS